MQDINVINSKKIIDEDTMKKIKEHANLYNNAYDKKSFLKNVSIFEQKIILMNSSNPYEVLNFLDELDLKSSRLLLEELSYDEINHIISLFSSEDKKRFYASFSDLSLVNQFIIQDKNAPQHIEDLSFERKVDLIDSTYKDTEKATSVLYESMPFEERISASEKITDIDAVQALESTAIYNETQQQETLNDELQQPEQTEIVQEKSEEENQEEMLQEEEKEEKDQQPKEQKEEKEQKEQQQAETIIDKLEEEPIVEENVTELEEEPIEEKDLTILEQFQQEKTRCEHQEIFDLMNKFEQLTPNENEKSM